VALSSRSAITGRLEAYARAAAQGQALLVAFAFGCLVLRLRQRTTSRCSTWRKHSNSALPLHYRIAGAWGGHEGSLLLWCLMLGVWIDGGDALQRPSAEEMTARVLGVMGLVSAGFIAFMLFTSNPFDRLFPAAEDWPRPESLLQDRAW
jgi:cytochrome c-type biogenesis protein CcmF